MTRRQFRLYFYFYIALFVVLLSAVLFYTLGYRYDYRTGATIQTGGMVVRSEVEGVSVFTNGESVKKNGLIDNLFSSFIKIDNLNPGHYMLEVKKDDYQTWHKEVEIAAGKLEKFENVLILKNHYEPAAVLPSIDLRTYRQVWYFPERGRIAYLDSVGDLYFLDIFKNQTALTLTAPQLEAMGEIRSITETEDSDLWLLRTHTDKIERLQALQTDVKLCYEIPAAMQEQMVEAFDRGKLKAQKDRLLFIEDGRLQTYLLRSKEVRLLAENVMEFAPAGENVFYTHLEPNGEVALYQKNSLGSFGAIKTVSLTEREFNPQAPFEVDAQGGKFLVRSENRLWLVDRYREFKKIADEIKDAQFFKNGGRVLFTTSHEMWIYYTETKTSQPIKFAGDKELITRWSGEIRAVKIYRDEEHLLYLTGKEWKVVELDGRYHRNTQILSSDITDQTFYDFAKNQAYFLKDGKVWSLGL